MLHQFANRRGLRVLALFCVTVLSACASGPVKPVENPAIILSAVPYLNFEVADQETRDDCDWNRELPANIVDESRGLAAINDSAFAEPGGRKLTMTIVNMHVIGGGAFTGPKWVVVHGKLTQDDKVIGTFEIGQTSIHGSFSACGTMRDLGEDLAEDIAEWLKHPSIDPAVTE